MKMNGVVKWYKENKKYGYIIGADDESYFFSIMNCVDFNETFRTGDKVLFIPEFGEMDYATMVEKVDDYEK